MTASGPALVVEQPHPCAQTAAAGLSKARKLASSETAAEQNSHHTINIHRTSRSVLLGPGF
jgi:hypothetical protein